MTGAQLYAFAGIALFVIGLHAVIRRAHLLRKVIALNVMSGGVFLGIAAPGAGHAGGAADPVPQALVITGIVLAVASTALALVLMLRVAAATGRAELPRRNAASR